MPVESQKALQETELESPEAPVQARWWHSSPVSIRHKVVRSLGRFTGIYLLALFVTVFALWIPDTFLSTDTFRNIAGGQGVTIILALGLLFTLAAGQYDLSVAQNLGLSAVIDADLMTHAHLAPGVAAVVTVLVGLMIGLVNGALVVGLAINSFIATLGMSSVLLAMTELISNNQFIGPVSTGFQNIAQSSPLGIPAPAIYAVGLGIIVWYVLEHTPIGRRFYATGANLEAARLAGVGVDRYVFGGFAVAGVCAALAGVLAVADVGEVSPTLGPSYLLPAFAACFLGTTQFKLGRFNVWGTVLAIYLLATGVTGLELAGGMAWITDLFDGLALIAAVGIAVASQGDHRLKLPHGRRCSPPAAESEGL